MQGFVCEEEDVAAIGTAYEVAKVIVLDGGKDAATHFARDGQSRKRPQSGYWSHLDLQLDQTADGVTTVSFQLFWDATCDDPASAEVLAVALASGGTDTSLRNTSVALRVSPTAPTSNQTTRQLFLLMKVDAGEATLKKARLHWKDQE